MEELHGLVRNPSIETGAEGPQSVFNLLLVDGREVPIQCKAAFSLFAGQQVNVYGQFDTEGNFIATTLTTSPAVVVSPQAGAQIRWKRMIAWALCGDLVMLIPLIAINAHGHSDGATVAFQAIIFAFVFATLLAIIFRGNPPAKNAWVAGLLAIAPPGLVSIAWAVLNNS